MEWRRAKARSSPLEWSSVDGDHFGFVALGAPKNPIAVDEEESEEEEAKETMMLLPVAITRC
jgi:hypothetical protein